MIPATNKAFCVCPDVSEPNNRQMHVNGSETHDIPQSAFTPVVSAVPFGRPFRRQKVPPTLHFSRIHGKSPEQEDCHVFLQSLGALLPVGPTPLSFQPNPAFVGDRNINIVAICALDVFKGTWAPHLERRNSPVRHGIDISSSETGMQGCGSTQAFNRSRRYRRGSQIGTHSTSERFC